MKLTLVRAHTLAAGIGIATLGASSIVSGALGWRSVPAPFVWLDVAVVYFLAALPLAASLVVTALRQLPWQKGTLAMLALEGFMLLFVPQFYTHVRCRHDLSQALQLSQQYRYAEASAHLHRLLALGMETDSRGTSLAGIAENMDRIVHDLESRVAAPLPDDAPDAERLDRATKLAVLGRNREALMLLDSSPALANDPATCNLRGTIYETQNQWRAARGWYSRARTAFQPLTDSTERQGGLERAVTGVAFCERKLGRLPEAETAWQELLALSPTADTHFLLAQFYEDAQVSPKAQFHARQAMKLDPQRYAASGRKLLDKIVTSHFGCWGAFTVENAMH